MELHCVRPLSRLTIHSFRCCPQVIPMFPQAFPQVCPQSPVRGTLGGMRVVHSLWICDTSIKRAACTCTHTRAHTRAHTRTRAHTQAHIRAYAHTRARIRTHAHTRAPPRPGRAPCLHRATIGCDSCHTTPQGTCNPLGAEYSHPCRSKSAARSSKVGSRLTTEDCSPIRADLSPLAGMRDARYRAQRLRNAVSRCEADTARCVGCADDLVGTRTVHVPSATLALGLTTTCGRSAWSGSNATLQMAVSTIGQTERSKYPHVDLPDPILIGPHRSEHHRPDSPPSRMLRHDLPTRHGTASNMRSIRVRFPTGHSSETGSD